MEGMPAFIGNSQPDCHRAASLRFCAAVSIGVRRKIPDRPQLASGTLDGVIDALDGDPLPLRDLLIGKTADRQMKDLQLLPAEYRCDPFIQLRDPFLFEICLFR